MEIQLSWQQGNFAITQLDDSILGSNLAHMFFVIIGSIGPLWLFWKHCCILLVYLAAMEVLFPWQQGNFKINHWNESNLSLYLAHMFFVTIHMTDLPGCYESTVNRDKRKSITFTVFRAEVLFPNLFTFLVHPEFENKSLLQFLHQHTKLHSQAKFCDIPIKTFGARAIWNLKFADFFLSWYHFEDKYMYKFLNPHYSCFKRSYHSGKTHSFVK